MKVNRCSHMMITFSVTCFILPAYGFASKGGFRCGPRLRMRLYHGPTSSPPSEADYLQKAEQAFRKLSRRRSSWKRFYDLADMAINSKIDEFGQKKHTKTFVDVGCDHGLFAASLAATGRFQSVLGVDASLSALEEGAFRLKEEIEVFRSKQQFPPLPLSFRVGNGLIGIATGQADVVCIAGMGVHTAVEILTETEEKTGKRLLDHLNCQMLLVQITNVRPRNLIHLFDNLRRLDWVPCEERIARVNAIWYFSVAFMKQPNDDLNDEVELLPGTHLVEATLPPEAHVEVLSYLSHFCTWLSDDARTGNLKGGEDRWLAKFDPIRIQLESSLLI